MSDLTLDDRGVLWAIAERDRVVVEMRAARQPLVRIRSTASPAASTPRRSPGSATAGSRSAIEGANTPTAGICSRSSTAIARRHAHARADVGRARRRARSSTTASRACAATATTCSPRSRRSASPDGSRWSPLVRLRGTRPASTKLRLTTRSRQDLALALHVRAPTARRTIVAIERHYRVSRILSFTVPRERPRSRRRSTSISRRSCTTRSTSRDRRAARRPARRDQRQSGQKRSQGPTELLVFAKR